MFFAHIRMYHFVAVLARTYVRGRELENGNEMTASNEIKWKKKVEHCPDDTARNSKIKDCLQGRRVALGH